MLDSLDAFIKAVNPIMMSIHGGQGNIRDSEAGDMYCPECQGARRMKIMTINANGIASQIWREQHGHQLSVKATGSSEPGTVPVAKVAKVATDWSELAPSLFWLQCVQCKSRFSALVYPGPAGPNLAIFPSTKGGLSTKNTDKNVAYFLDEAYKAQCGGSITGAVLMYRASLEQLLTEQKYLHKNITDKIKALEEDVKNGTGPPWVHDIDAAFLRVIKDLANEGIHVNSGDTATLAAFDTNLISELHILFTELLDLVYEKPLKKAEKLKLLQGAMLFSRQGFLMFRLA